MRLTSAHDRVAALAGALLACAPLMAATVRAQEEEIFEDLVTRENLPPLDEVRIEEDSWKYVRARKQAGQIPVPAYEVIEVSYAQATRDFSRGIRRVRKGYYGRAMDSFLPTLEKLSNFRKVGGRPWPEQYCLYYLGYAHLMRGEKGDAAKAREYFQKLVKEIPETRFIFEARLGLAESYQIEERFEEAEKAYKDAEKNFERMSRDPELSQEHVKQIRRHVLLAALHSIEMLDARGKFDLASSAYKRLVNRAREYPEIQSIARVGAVRTLVSSKLYDRAIADCDRMIDEGEREGNTEYLGGAYLALADCHFERAGEEEASREDLVVARWNYLRVATLYFFERKLLPKARFRAARCFERLAGLAREGEGAGAWRQAARQYKLVIKEFPSSPWALEAQKSLQALGR